MNILRRLPLSRLLLLCAVVVIAGAGVAVAASLGGGPKPAPQPLAGAIHDALVAPPVQGVSARITLTNNLLTSSSVQGNSPLLNGASGRLWASEDGRVRLELQSNRGDVQIVYDGTTLSYLDSASGTLYRVTLPRHQATGSTQQTKPESHSVPTVADVQSFLSKLMQHVTVSGAVPDDVAGRPAYKMTLSPSHDGGLVGGAALWWDAVHGVPLRLAIYATGRTDPVFELGVTHISFGKVDSSVFALHTSGKVQQVTLPSGPSGSAAAHSSSRRAHSAAHRHSAPRVAVGASAAQAQLPFKLSAPSTLDGRQLSQVQSMSWNGHAAALVSYGQGLGGLYVIERAADASHPASSPAGPSQPAGHSGAAALPAISINGSPGTELPTALGTIVSFQRGGVAYIVAGSVPPNDVVSAARGL